MWSTTVGFELRQALAPKMPERLTPPVAKRDSWKLEPVGPMEPLPYRGSFGREEYATIRRGLVPEAMEDKWFIFFENHVLFLHRSWSGHCIYRVEFQETHDGAEVTQASVATGERFYDRRSAEYETQLLDFLIRGLLLGHPVRFPVPADVPDSAPAGLFQHHVAGTGAPEKRATEPRGAWGRLVTTLARWLHLRRP